MSSTLTPSSSCFLQLRVLNINELRVAHPWLLANSHYTSPSHPCDPPNKGYSKFSLHVIHHCFLRTVPKPPLLSISFQLCPFCSVPSSYHIMEEETHIHRQSERQVVFKGIVTSSMHWPECSYSTYSDQVHQPAESRE